ncbi:hypothetical protein Tco_0832597 [Tanacetum coccineum]
MDNTRAQQKALDDELVAPADRLKIGKSNLRLSSILKSKEPTLQVALDALKLTPFYNAFEISADVPEIYMQEFWVTVSRHHSSLRFKLNGKSHTVNVDNFRDMLKICPKLPEDDFKFTNSKVISKHQDTQVYGAILPYHLTNQAMLESEAYMTYRAYATAQHMKNAIEKEQIQLHSSHATWLQVMSCISVKESEELSWTFSQGEDDEENDEHDSEDDNDEHDSENDNDDEDDDQENVCRETQSDDDGEENQEDDDNVMGGEQEDEEDEELYGDMNLNLDRRDTEMTDAHTNQETKEVHVTLTIEPLVVQQQISFVSSDLFPLLLRHLLLTLTNSLKHHSNQTTSTNKHMIPQQQPHSSTNLQTSPNSTASQYGFERRVSSLETELSELKQTNQFVEAVSSIPGIVDNYLASKLKDVVDVAVQLQSNKLREEAQVENDEFLKHIDSNIKAIIKDQVKAQVSKIMPKVEKYVTESLGAEVLARSSNQPQTSYAATASLSEFELKKILIDKIDENKSMNRSDVQKNLYNALIESYNSDKDLFASYGDVVTLKRGRDDQYKDEEPSARSNRGTKKGDQARKSKSAQAKEHGPRVDDLEEPSHQEFNTGNDDVSPAREVTDVDARLWNLPGSQTPNQEWNKTKTVDDRPPQSWMT